MFCKDGHKQGRRMMAALFCAFLLVPLTARAESGCMLAVSYPDGKTLYENGACQERHSPFSTFKVPLAVMGFDSGILVDAHTPSLPYRDEYHGSDREKKTTDPTIWEKDSIVWYSQQLTQKLGMESFQRYTDQFDYGNRDLSGGLTHAWLGTSLQISPREETVFITRLLNRDLGVSDHAYAMTLSVMPQFPAADGWTLYGKTGSGWARDKDGKFDDNKPQGWFVGWAEKDGLKVIFATFIADNVANAEYGGPRARQKTLAELPALLSAQ